MNFYDSKIDFALYERCRKIIKSCKTTQQGEIAKRYIYLAIPKMFNISRHKCDYKTACNNVFIQQLLTEVKIKCYPSGYNVI